MSRLLVERRLNLREECKEVEGKRIESTTMGK
jgi:hypothetical protein